MDKLLFFPCENATKYATPLLDDLEFKNSSYISFLKRNVKVRIFLKLHVYAGRLSC